jgi:hypothetical protein
VLISNCFHRKNSDAVATADSIHNRIHTADNNIAGNRHCRDLDWIRLLLQTLLLRLLRRPTQIAHVVCEDSIHFSSAPLGEAALSTPHAPLYDNQRMIGNSAF